MDTPRRCVVNRPIAAFAGKQGLACSVGISRESAGASMLHMQRVTIPPRIKGEAHKHVAHETAIDALGGRSGCWFDERLKHHVELAAGEFRYIAAATPHLPYNPSASDNFVGLIARSDPNEQESVTMLPELDNLPHIHALLSGSESTGALVD